MEYGFTDHGPGRELQSTQLSACPGAQSPHSEATPESLVPGGTTNTQTPQATKHKTARVTFPRPNQRL